jgi:hypothetical protein
MKVIVLVKATTESEAGVMPSHELLEAMGKFNEELVTAGVMQAGEGLHPTAKGARVTFRGADREVTKGPFALDNTVSGFWIWKVASMDEAISWAKRCPNPGEGESELEIRPVFEAEDFGDAFTPELREQEEKLREKISKAS